MALPDIVADYLGLTEVEREQRRFDRLNYDRLPPVVGLMNLEWREHPLSMPQRLAVAIQQFAVIVCGTFTIGDGVLAPVFRSFGEALLSPFSYPIVFLLCGFLAYVVLVETSSFGEAFWAFIAPQGMFVFLELSFSPSLNRYFSLVPLAAGLFAVGYLVDRINTHYVRWLTANLSLKPEFAASRRKQWDQRFHIVSLGKTLRAREREARALAGQDSDERRAILLLQIEALRELRSYPARFVILVYIGVLVSIGATGMTLLVWSGLLAAALSLKRCTTEISFLGLLRETVIWPCVSWFSWDTQQLWTNAPGYFSDKLEDASPRITQSAFCLLVISIALTPPLALWGITGAGTVANLWSIVFDFATNALLPIMIVFIALFATGGRILWMHFEAIELGQSKELFYDESL
jgi:hypothetical protein